MKSFRSYLKENFRKSYWNWVWVFFAATVLLLVVFVVSYAVFYVPAAQAGSLQPIDVVILFGLVVAAIPTLFFASLLSAAFFSSIYLGCRYLCGHPRRPQRQDG